MRLQQSPILVSEKPERAVKPPDRDVLGGDRSGDFIG